MAGWTPGRTQWSGSDLVTFVICEDEESITAVLEVRLFYCKNIEVYYHSEVGVYGRR